MKLQKVHVLISKLIYLLHPIKLIKYFFFGIHPSDIKFELVVSRLPEKATIVEAGTSTGMHTKKFADAFPFGQIIGFEPISELLEICKQRTQNYPNVTISNHALGEPNETEVQIFWDESIRHDSASTLTPKRIMKNYYPSLQFNTVRTVPVIALDEVMTKFGLTKIDLLWLDLQGAELRVLEKGGQKTLSRNRYLHVEVARKAMYEGEATRTQIIRFMHERDFAIELSAMGWMYGNILFRNNNIE